MKPLDYTFFLLMGVLLVAAGYSFARIEKYLIAHRLVNPTTSHPNLLEFYRKYVAHTKDHTGRVDRMFWIHVCAGAAFIILGMVYALIRLVPYVLSHL